MRWNTRLAWCWATGFAAALTGCDGGDADVLQPQTPAVGVTVASAAITVTQGQNATAVATVSRSGGYDGPVVLSLESAPTGVTGSFSPGSIPAGSTNSTLTLNASLAAAAGTHNLTVRASGQGTQDATASLVLTVLERPGIALAVDPTAITMVQNASGTVSVNVARTNFDGAVQLSLTGAPAGVTGTFAPAVLAGAATTSTLTLTAATAAALGSATLTITAQAPGVESRTATVGLTVQPMPSYTLAVNPAALTVAPGGSGTATVTLARTNFASPVGLSIAGVPTGATAAIDPATTEQSTATLTVNAGSATPGSYTVTITGTAAGLEDRTATLALTISAAGDYTLSVSPSILRVEPGRTMTATVTAVGSGGATGNAALSVSGAPAGVTTSIADSVSIDVGRGRNTIASMGSTTLTVTVAATAAPGTYPLTITATAPVLGTRTAQLDLIIELAGGFSLSVTPTTATVLQGGMASATVHVQRSGGFAGAVDLSVIGLPAGVAATFSPPSPTGSSASVQFAVSPSAAAGTSNLTIVGSAPGRPDQTTSMTLEVVAATGSHSLQFCGEDAPIWLAVQDGDGPWTRVAGVGDRYSFDLPSGRGGIAYVTRTGATYSTIFIFGTSADLDAGDIGVAPCGMKTVHGSAGTAGFGSPQLGVTLGPVSRPPSAFVSFRLDNVPDGPHDLVATLAGISGTAPARRVIVRRDVNPPHNSTLPVLDFGTIEAQAAEEHGLTINGLAQANGLVQYTSLFITPTTPAMLFAPAVAVGAEHRWYAVPEPLRRSSDLHGLTVTAVDNTNEVRTVREYFSNPSDRTLALGPPIAAPPTFTVITATPYRRPRMVHNVDSNYGSVTSITYSQSFRSVTAIFSAAYVNGGAIDLTVPDLTQGAGYQADWGLRAQSLEAVLIGGGWNGTSSGFAERPADGVVMRGFAQRVVVP
jgi:uncharacterized membrane protein